ncbi:MAG: 3'(2'),5'-bisphosphate nucleotidase [Desulfovibrionaceae bacterium CG1_02_65_16]|nr:MAG: 3'(2'),5'-bisphosphate nucleotidase [Desulfovibrionaceae bacterium CG1_02_65_16]
MRASATGQSHAPAADLAALADIAEAAGRAILEVRARGYSVEYKADASPLTQADLASNAIITRALAERFPGVPVLSEEGADIPYAERAAWPRLFIVDPLDGTKEFVKELGEFCVCIALAENGFPAHGVVHVPVWGKTYAGGLGLGAYRREAGGEWEAIRVRQPDSAERSGYTVLGSRSHPDPAIEAWLADKPVRERVTAGSALKFCVLAEGAADLYPRFNPTREWDTAAGQAVLEGAGGSMVRLTDAESGGVPGGRLPVNKPDLFNGPFLASAKPLG